MQEFIYEQREPFHVIDNIYYIGNTFVSCFLFTSDEGHVVIDTGFPGDAPHMVKHIEQLGFSAEDVKYIVATHAHVDHVGGLAELKELTGAIVCAGEGDVFYIENDGKAVGSDVLELPEVEPCKVDRVLKDGDLIEVGSTRLRVYETPGHSTGSVSFGFQVSDQGKKYDSIVYGGFGLNVFEGMNLKHNVYGADMGQYIASLERVKGFDVDVWLSGHYFFDGTFEKLKNMEQQEDDKNPFIDPEGWNSFLADHLIQTKELREKISV